MPIIPDTKNWTWVLERPCGECGFDASGIDVPEVAERLRANALSWPAVLRRADAASRPNDSTWSPLEYSAHVRDVFRLFRYRLALMLDEDDPLFPNWNQDETAVAERYGEQDPEVVSVELVEAADELVALIETVPAEAYARTGRRGDGAEFTVSSFLIYLLHDPVHHRWDVKG